jgi:hypothetical protein
MLKGGLLPLTGMEPGFLNHPIQSLATMSMSHAGSYIVVKYYYRYLEIVIFFLLPSLLHLLTMVGED